MVSSVLRQVVLTEEGDIFFSINRLEQEQDFFIEKV